MHGLLNVRRTKSIKLLECFCVYVCVGQMQTNDCVFFSFFIKILHWALHAVCLPSVYLIAPHLPCVHAVGGQGDACRHAVNGGCMCAGGGIHVVDRGMHVCM